MPCPKVAIKLGVLRSFLAAPILQHWLHHLVVAYVRKINYGDVILVLKVSLVM